MVKSNAKVSIPEDHGDIETVNKNGKRCAEEQNNGGNKRLRTKSLYRQPTVNELNRLQETETLFNSNFFRLQVEEIIKEVKVKEKTEKKFTEWFTSLKKQLLSIPEDDTEYDLSENTLFKKLKVKIPVSEQLNKTKCVFKFHKFKDIEVIGSYDLGCCISSKLIVDLQITVPADTYTKNDSVNYKYHKKRAAYLAYIASHLSKCDLVEELQYSFSKNCESKPVLDFKPTGKLGKHLSVRLHLVCENDAYKLHRFSPERNNLREAWLFNENTENTEVGPPTPYYNSSVLSDLTTSINHELLREIFKDSENLKQAVVLIKIWLRQRNLQVSGYVVCLLVAYFVQTKRINNFMSSYQIVRNIWIALKTSDLDKNGLSLQKGQDQCPKLEAFRKHFSVVFIDKTGYYNICWQMGRGTYNMLVRECALAIEMLDNAKINTFLPLFMTPVKVLMQFDHVLRFKSLPQVKESVLAKSPKESQLNYGLDQLAFVTDIIYQMLAKGLGNRVEVIKEIVEDSFSWPIKKTFEKARSGFEEKLSFGLVLNSENCMNIVEKGPPANLQEAEQFRAFWGNKSELRRFQDGSITETCVWEGDTMTEQRTVTKQIIDYLIKLKFDISPEDIYHISSQCDSVLARKQWTSTDVLYSEETSLNALRTFDELRRDLRQLQQLPLDVSAVYGVSSVFSYSCPLPPLIRAAPHNPWQRGSTCLVKDIKRPDGVAAVPDYTPVCKAVVELGHSGKWPGNLQAFRCLKAAFHLQIAERLNKQYSLPTQAYPTHIDVLKNGLVFRLEIAHPKEITLLRREIENGVVKFKENEESVRLQVNTVLMPRLRGALHGLHQKYPSFGPTVCLFKRWLSSHLLSPPHFPDNVAELIVAAVYLYPEPTQPPAMSTVGLVRALNKLVDFDWASEIIFLGFNDDMSHEDKTNLEQKLSTGEDRPCMCIVTSYDGPLPSVCSREGPSEQVLARARALATSTLNYLDNAILTDFKDNVLGIFVPSLSGYDVLIHLHTSLVPYSAERVDQKPRFQNLPDKPAEDIIPVVEFHPVLNYLEELRSAYGDFALFFHDIYGGEVIGVLWRPEVQQEKEFQLTNANALKPVSSGGELKYKVNLEALVEDFRILGEGLVRDITVQ